MHNSHRLTGHIRPERYRLVFKPDFKKFEFFGEETIYLSLGRPSKKIILHAKELRVISAEFVSERHTHKVKRIAYNDEAETVTFEFNRLLEKGKAELRLKFQGELNDKMRGFYRSHYLYQGKRKYLATTQFEATDARRAFPCFDEPEAKAIFDVSVIVPKSLAVVSNTVETKVSEHQAGLKLVEFEPTPKMSTYLLAIIVGDLEFIEARTKRGVLVRVFTTPGKKQHAKFALTCAIRALDFYEKYFDIHYPLPVLDMVAVPDFASAAMENWGAIVYRETALLVDEDNSSITTKQWVAIVVAHEIAHMWFGNLVTMEWWTHLWLNEGFASYMEYKCVDELFPKWRMWERYVSGRMSAALRLDALKNTHPIEVEVKHPGQISEIFDEVSYAKGSVIIRMLAEYLGEKTFRDGLRYYLKKHAYKNTRTEDLWAALQKVSGKPVKKLMASWTNQPGYPLIILFGTETGLKLSQSRFYSSRLSRLANRKDQQWWQVPIDAGNRKFLLGRQPITLFKLAQVGKLNMGETTLMRVSYPKAMMRQLAEQVKRKSLEAIDRLGLIRDAFALAESGQMSTTEVLELALAYQKEDSLVVWEELVDGLARLRSLVYATPFFSDYLKYCRNLFKKIYNEIGWKERYRETHDRQILRSLILSQLGASGEHEVLSKAHKLFWSKKTISPNLRATVYTLAVRAGGKPELEFLIKKYRHSNSHEEQDRIGRALTQFQNPNLIQHILKFSLSKHVRSQDAPFILAAALQNPAARDITWNFIAANWQKLRSRYGDGLGLLGRLIKAAGVFTSWEKHEQLQKFFQNKLVPGAERAIQQALEKIASNADWLSRDGQSLEQWLKNYKHEK